MGVQRSNDRGVVRHVIVAMTAGAVIIGVGIFYAGLLEINVPALGRLGVATSQHVSVGHTEERPSPEPAPAQPPPELSALLDARLDELRDASLAPSTQGVLVETLFGVAIRADDAPVWHPSVRYFGVWRGGERVAAFYLDPYARPGKQQGAWMDDGRARWRRPEGRLQMPVAHLVCNFAPPVDGRPALLAHDDVVTLFHEFGHGLHHMLTRVDHPEVAGTSGVEWDAVELPSQFMENWCYHKATLLGFARHFETGEPLSQEMFDRIVAARSYRAGSMFLRQIYFATLDLELYHRFDAANANDRSLTAGSGLVTGLPPGAPRITLNTPLACMLTFWRWPQTRPVVLLGESHSRNSMP